MEKEALKSNIKIVFFTQIAVLLVGILKSMFLPLIFSIEEFGYWQIYLLYSSYVGLFALGFNDGIYLRYGNYDYQDLPFDKLRGAMWLYAGILFFLSLLMAIFAVTSSSGARLFALLGVVSDILIMGLTGVYVFIYQVTNQMKKYSVFSLLDKGLMIIAIGIMVMLHIGNYQTIIIVDVMAKLLVVILMMRECKELFVGKCMPLTVAIEEYRDNVKAGICLMFANIMGMLILGLGRFFIERFGTIKEFAQYSFGLTVTNIVIVMITAVSLALYPTLKRLPENNYKDYFERIEKIILKFNLLSLLVYFITYYIVRKYYQAYIPVIVYLNVLFIIVALQSKMQLLNNTFYKVLREEKMMLNANLSCVLFFLFLCLSFLFIDISVYLIAIYSLIAMFIRCYVSEYFLGIAVRAETKKTMSLEIAMLTFFFVFTSYFF